MKQVLLGIQARSTSTRLPQKAHLPLAGKTILRWVVDSCLIAQRFLMSESHKLNVNVRVALLIPKGDSIGEIYRGQIPIVEGSETDVLSRYLTAAETFEADIVARITADCAFLPPHHIAKHVKAAILKDRDLTTNVHFRTHKEGWDCEVLSRRLLEWLGKHATDPKDREHVTTKIAHGQPFPFKFVDGKPSICHIMNNYDESHIKTSIDTPEDYEAAKKILDNYDRLKKEAKRNGTYLT